MKIPKDLQKKNFYDAMKIMLPFEGWEILEEQNLLALKFSGLPFINMVWGDPTFSNINKVIKFYAKTECMWMLTKDQDGSNLIQAGFEEPHPAPEMVLELDSYISHKRKSEIKVIEVKTKKELHDWATVGAPAFGVDVEGMKAFFSPLIDFTGDIPYLGLYNGELAATSLVFCHDGIAGVYAMSTLGSFRRKGLAMAMTDACLTRAKDQNMKYAVLYASKMGEPLYRKMGFETAQVLREYRFVP